jgi:hypothetical protein
MYKYEELVFLYQIEVYKSSTKGLSSYLAVEIAPYLAIDGGSGCTRMGSFVQIHHVDDQW